MICKNSWKYLKGFHSSWGTRFPKIEIFKVAQFCKTVGRVMNLVFCSLSDYAFGGGRVARWCWVNFQCRGVLLTWIIVGLGPIALAEGAGGGCLDIFSLVYHFSFPLFGRRPDSDWNTVSKAVKPKATNKPTDYALYLYKIHENILNGFRVIERTRFQIYKFSKENNSVKKEGGVMGLVLC